MTNDEHLFHRLKLDRQTFGEVFDRYYQPIFGYIFRRVADFDISRDIAAETFLKAYIGIDQFSWRGIPISAWLYKIATNELALYYRTERYRSSLVEKLKAEPGFFRFQQAVDEDITQLRQEQKRYEAFEQIQKQLRHLPVRYQDVIALRYFESKSIAEISQILSMKEGTVKSLLSRGIEKLKVLCETDNR